MNTQRHDIDALVLAWSAAVEECKTLPHLLRYNAKHYGDKTALREKDYGIWQTMTWREYADEVEYLALAFADMGLQKSDVVALLGGNGIYWTRGALAAHANGALSLGVYADVLGPEAFYQLNTTGVVAAVVEDEEQADKLISLGDTLPKLRYIIYKEARGMRKYDDPRLLSLDEAMARGRKLAEAQPQKYDSMIDGNDADDSAMLVSTSGTTDNPKFAEIAHRPFLRHVVKYLQCDPKTDSDEYVSALPLPWIMETKYVLGKSLVCRMKINFAESPDTLMDDLREIGPTFILLAPRVWEQIAGSVRARISDSTFLKRTLFNWGVKRGIAHAKNGQHSRLADWAVFRALRDSLGFSRVLSASTGGAALGPDTYQFFVAAGIPLKQIYGQTELLGAYTAHWPGEVDFETSGRPFDGVEVRIEDADSEGLGRIVTRNPNMMRCYYGAPEETKNALKDGWLDTGDAGYFKPSGQLVVVDRFRDLSRTAQGVNFSPQYLENKLKFSPYIAEAVVFGNERDSLTAMVCIRLDVLSKWAERRRIAFTNYADLATRAEVRELIKIDIIAANETLPVAQRLRRFVLLYKELDADDGELTRTKKVRRNVINERYSGIIDSLYSEDNSIKIDTEIVLQDGGRQRVKTVLQIETLQTSEPNKNAL